MADPAVTQLTSSTTEVSTQRSAAQTVFNIPELLTAILLALPSEDLLLAARVNITWHDLITTSATLYNHFRAVDFSAISQDYFNGVCGSENSHFVISQRVGRDILARRVDDSEVICITRSYRTTPRRAFTIVDLSVDRATCISIRIRRQRLWRDRAFGWV